MKKCILIFFLLAGFFDVFSGKETSRGTRFWLSQISDGTHTGNPYNLILSGKNACTVKIENQNTGHALTVNLPAGTFENIVLPTEEIQADLFDVVMGKSILITSTDTISVYIQYNKSASSDIGWVLPEDILGSEYIVQTYPSLYDSGEFLILATEDNTTIDIIPSCSIEGGHAEKVPFAILLNKGEVYQARSTGEQSSDPRDLSGSRISSRNGKKIAVFSGSSLGYVPYNFSSADYIFDQALPLDKWGKEFAIVNALNSPVNRVRVTASADNTVIRRNRERIATLQADETFEFEIYDHEYSCFLETSEPCMVYQYMTGYAYASLLTSSSFTRTDPSMTMIPPVKYKLKEITFGTSHTGTIDKHYISIVVNTSDVSTVKLDNQPVQSSFSPLTGNPALSYARINLSEGYHTLQSSQGFVSHAYGYGEFESYNYCLGIGQEEVPIPPSPLQIEWKEIPEICGDDSHAGIIYHVLSGEIASYSLEYDRKAFDRGFRNVINQPAHNDNKIELLLPEQLIPDIYEVNVVFYDLQGLPVSIPLSFTVNYSSAIIVQRWNDILAVKNTGFNGGFIFSDFQWYKNDTKIPGETGSYLYTPDELDMEAEYRARITRADDGVTLFTCPVTPVSLNVDLTLILHPTVLNRNEELTIEAGQRAKAVIWNATGIKIREIDLEKGKNLIRMEYPPGIYIIKASGFNENKLKHHIIIIK